MEIQKPFDQAAVEVQLAEAGVDLVGQTYSDLFIVFKDDPDVIKKHPIQAELVARAWELAGGIASGRLHKQLTHDEINAAGRSMLADLKASDLIKP